jgi:hypothetical protein
MAVSPRRQVMPGLRRRAAERAALRLRPPAGQGFEREREQFTGSARRPPPRPDQRQTRIAGWLGTTAGVMAGLASRDVDGSVSSRAAGRVARAAGRGRLQLLLQG